MEFRQLVQHARTHAQRRSPETGRRLAAGQSPTALFITCADSRIVPSAITGAEPGSLFELRTAGNVIPEFNPHTASAEMATVEFAVVQLGVSEIVVCGHSHCGAVDALHADRRALTHLPTLMRWLAAHAPYRTGRPTPGLREEGREHVLAQLRALEAYPFVRDRIAAGELRTHGWFYDIETGEVSLCGADRFQPLQETVA
ncbi:carbonic anhydrase [Saccharothrix variisporea]|uniref:Carbonic anhydrase n=1 Tax=Saccharothrix variisporea TaxID=543527 RepID=A0A495X8P1_9PSEU|nr:carbonic anhydrase [Saccharothrix variisporea]RKT69979.1 carbonic anhydrase [Saccharothrix variisporea]